MTKKLSLLLTLLTLFALGACAANEDGLVVDGVWARPSPPGAPTAAIYMNITNNTGNDEVLREIQVENCSAVEVHETSMEEDVMRMRPVEGQEIMIPAGQTISLEAGELHVMCIGLDEPFELGQEIPLTLVFANAGQITVTAEIRQEPSD